MSLELRTRVTHSRGDATLDEGDDSRPKPTSTVTSARRPSGPRTNNDARPREATGRVFPLSVEAIRGL